MLLIVGSHIIISSTVLHIRKRAFQSKFKALCEARQRLRQNSDGEARVAYRVNAEMNEAYRLDRPELGRDATWDLTAYNTSSEEDNVPATDIVRPQHHHGILPLTATNIPGYAVPCQPQYEEREASTFKNAIRGTHGYLLPSRSLGSRNSQFHELTFEDRAEFGGIEYRAISLLSILVPVYFFSFLIIGLVSMGIWMLVNHSYVARDNGLHPFFTGAFFAVSAFVNSGMALLDANMTALQREYVLSTFQFHGSC